MWRNLGGTISVAQSRQHDLTNASGVGAQSRQRVWLRDVEGSLLSFSLSLALFARLSPEMV